MLCVRAIPETGINKEATLTTKSKFGVCINSNNLPFDLSKFSVMFFISSKLIINFLSFLSEAQKAFKNSKRDSPNLIKLNLRIVFISFSVFSGKHFLRFHLAISRLSSNFL